MINLQKSCVSGWQNERLSIFSLVLKMMVQKTRIHMISMRAHRNRNLLLNVAARKDSEISWEHLSIGPKWSEKRGTCLLEGHKLNQREWVWLIFTVQIDSNSEYFPLSTYIQWWITDKGLFSKKQRSVGLWWWWCKGRFQLCPSVCVYHEMDLSRVCSCLRLLLNPINCCSLPALSFLLPVVVLLFPTLLWANQTGHHRNTLSFLDYPFLKNVWLNWGK